LNFVVQTDHDAPIVAAEGRKWLLEEFIPALEKMPRADFLAAQASLLKDLRLKPASFKEQFRQLESGFLLDLGYGLDAQVADAVEKLSQSEIVETFTQLLAPKERRELSIYLNSSYEDRAQPTMPGGERVLSSLEEYRQLGCNWYLRQNQ
jgi:secreted Zn-dependent insulinase-like peptidase